MKINEIKDLDYRMSLAASVKDVVNLIGTTADYESKTEGIYFSDSRNLQEDVIFQRDDVFTAWTVEKLISFIYVLLEKIAPVVAASVKKYGAVGPMMVANPESTILVAPINKYIQFMIADGQHRFRWLTKLLRNELPFPKVPASMKRDSDKEMQKIVSWYVVNFEGRYFSLASRPCIPIGYRAIFESCPIIRVEMGDGSSGDFIYRNSGIPVSKQLATKMSISENEFVRDFNRWMFEVSRPGRTWACAGKSLKDYAMIDSLYIINFLTMMHISEKNAAVKRIGSLPFGKEMIEVYGELTDFMNTPIMALQFMNRKHLCQKSMIAYIKTCGGKVKATDISKALDSVLAKYKVPTSERMDYINEFTDVCHGSKGKWTDEMLAEGLTACAALVVKEMKTLVDTLNSPNMQKKFLEYNAKNETYCTNAFQFVLGVKAPNDNGSTGACNTTRMMQDNLNILGVA